MASLIKAIAAYARQDFPEITVTKVFKRFSCYYFLLLIRLIVNHVALHHSLCPLLFFPQREKDGGRARESGPGNEVAMYKEIIPQPSPTRVATFPSDYVYVLWYLL